jgi:hypothetical protein
VIAEQRSALLGGQHWQPWYRHVLFITGWLRRASLLEAAACGSALLLAAALPARTCCACSKLDGRPGQCVLPVVRGTAGDAGGTAQVHPSQVLPVVARHAYPADVAAP